MKRYALGKLRFMVLIAVIASFLTIMFQLRLALKDGRPPMIKAMRLFLKGRRGQPSTLIPLPNCSTTPESLIGPLSVDLTPLNLSLENLQVNSSGIQFGGWWRPRHCNPKVKVAILIPYRNRLEQLKIFLRHMIPILERQLLSYRIFVIEQVGKTAFNKGAIFNIGFNATLSFDDYDCYIFHDVDLLAENDLNYYGCPTSPRHMSVAIDKFGYRLPYTQLVGGIQAFTKKHYIMVNGYSNKYWGWGAEDDDLSRRIKYSGLALTRPAFGVGRYKMNQKNHFRSDPLNPENNKVFNAKSAQDKMKDGLNTIGLLNKAVQIHETRLCTFVSINLTRS